MRRAGSRSRSCRRRASARRRAPSSRARPGPREPARPRAASSRRSSPQNSSPPTTTVGTPMTPRACASSVAARSASLTAGPRTAPPASSAGVDARRSRPTPTSDLAAAEVRAVAGRPPASPPARTRCSRPRDAAKVIARATWRSFVGHGSRPGDRPEPVPRPRAARTRSSAPRARSSSPQDLRPRRLEEAAEEHRLASAPAGAGRRSARRRATSTATSRRRRRPAARWHTAASLRIGSPGIAGPLRERRLDRGG